MKILLINVNTCVSPYPVYPLGMSHVASYLVKQGFDVVLGDMSVEPDLEAVVSREKPDLIGLSLRNIDDVQIENPKFFAKILTDITARMRKVSSAKIMIGGSGYSLFPQRLLADSGADFGVAAEGESAVAALASALQNGKDFSSIPGLVFRTVDGNVVANPGRNMPASEITVPLRPESLAKYYISKSTMLNVQTQRGCSFNCCYCTYPLIEGVAFRKRSGAEVAEDFASAKAAGAKYVFVVDSVFNTDIPHVRDICEELIRREIGIEWSCFLRPQGLDVDLMSLMKRAGLRHVEFGTDALSDTTLAAYGKGFTFEDVYLSSEAARLAGVHFAHFLITGGPSETESTIIEGFENSKRIKKTVFFPFIGMRLYPGTPLYKTAIAEGSVPKGTDFLQPYFYVTPHVSTERMAELLRGFNKISPRWVVGDLPPEMVKVMDGLKNAGVLGPMWEFLAR